VEWWKHLNDQSLMRDLPGVARGRREQRGLCGNLRHWLWSTAECITQNQKPRLRAPRALGCPLSSRQCAADSAVRYADIDQGHMPTARTSQSPYFASWIWTCADERIVGGGIETFRRLSREPKPFPAASTLHVDYVFNKSTFRRRWRLPSCQGGLVLEESVYQFEIFVLPKTPVICFDKLHSVQSQRIAFFGTVHQFHDFRSPPPGHEFTIAFSMCSSTRFLM
jgi:hypothetical protein